ncbi:MAG: restriction endonuclease [Spirochaetes bacterium]|nr:restriction endonuclease [Spirochaetota bacterium]
MGYDFSKLNDREFEELGADIISEHFGVKVEIFKAGKDGGVDGRFWLGKNEEVIIQCKHYLKTGYKGLIRKLKKEEAAKVKKLNPEKYIFVTSVGLSQENKKEIKDIFSPYIKIEGDIWGKEDLNIFLLKNEKLVERNYKLWITSTKVFDILFNNAIKGRSKSIVEEIKEHTYKYAKTENHNQALELLKKKNVVIITGEPGIGKSTLADNLAAFYVSKGYEFCAIEESISEAESLFRESEKKKILFYFDDFLGSSLPDAVSNKKDSHIVNFINRIRKDKTKKFILTSRTNFLNEAYSLSHQFQNKNIRDDEFLLKVENLTEIDKAKILYNHIYHSNLDKSYIDKIYEEKRYREIINHQNFSPRIIEFITDSERVANVGVDQYWNYIQESLNNPKDIWEYYFQDQTDDFIRGLTFLTVFNNGKILEKQLKKAYSDFKDIQKLQPNNCTDKSFSAVIKLATKSLLNRNQISKNSYEYALFNPSIADFILENYIDENKLIINIFKSLQTKESLRYLKNLIINKKLCEKDAKKIQMDLFKYLFDDKLDNNEFDYLILLADLNFSNTKVENEIIKFLNKIVNLSSNEIRVDGLSEFLSLINIYAEKIKMEDYKFILNFINSKELDENEIIDLLNFIKEFEIDNENILLEIGEKVENYQQNELEEYKGDINLSEFIKPILVCEKEINYEVDESGIEMELDLMLDTINSNFDDEVLKKLCIDRSDIVRLIDIDEMKDKYLEDLGEDYAYDDIKYNFKDNFLEDNIDAIFERS